MRRLVALIGLISVALPVLADGGIVRLRSGWEYRWGDSHRQASGEQAWARVQEADQAWRPIAAPCDPPGRESRQMVWYRVRLPQTEATDARLFIYSIDLAAEVFVDGTRIYRWGRPTEHGHLAFRGWPWHLVPLPAGYGGKLLAIRVASDYHDIGLWGDVLVGSGFDQIARMAGRDVPRLLVATLSLLIAIVFFVLFLHRRESPTLLLALLTATLVVRVVAQTQVKQLVLDAPLLWEHVRTMTGLVALILITHLLHDLLGPLQRNVTRVMAVCLTAVLAVGTLASVTGLLRLCDAMQAVDVVEAASMLALATLSVLAAAAGSFEAKLLTANFVVLGVLAFRSILVSNGFIPWNDEMDYLMLFQFSAGLAVILGRRFWRFSRTIERYAEKLASQAEEMSALNERLEEKVAQRTRQLERANRRLREEKISLQITSITDGLTGLYNRTYSLDRFERELGKTRRYGKRLSIIMMDLDHFKLVNDSFGHQAGDLVMQRVGGLFRDMLRESDLAGRYGGEEFLIVLPEADAVEAGQVAERMRADVEALEWPQPELKVTLSAGVAQFAGENADQLLQRADYLLYKAKEAGRNRVMTEAIAALTRSAT